MTRIVVDAMGSDNYPTPDVEGAIMAAREYGVEIILTGDASKLQPILDSNNGANLPIRIINAPEMLTMHDKGEDLVMKARHKEAQNSMAVGYDLVKNGEADAFVTAGNTGAAMVTALFRLGRIRGVDRPALAPSPLLMVIALFWILARTPIANQKIFCSLPLWAVFLLNVCAA